MVVVLTSAVILAEPCHKTYANVQFDIPSAQADGWTTAASTWNGASDTFSWYFWDNHVEKFQPVYDDPGRAHIANIEARSFRVRDCAANSIVLTCIHRERHV